MNKTLKSFVNYCLAHPQERFWQALRNWSGYNFIFGSKEYTFKIEESHLEDTFYIEDEK